MPEPLGPSSAVSAPALDVERDVVERDEVAEALGDVAHEDRHLGGLLLGSDDRQRNEDENRDSGEHDRDRVGAGEVERFPPLLHA